MEPAPLENTNEFAGVNPSDANGELWIVHGVVSFASVPNGQVNRAGLILAT